MLTLPEISSHPSVSKPLSHVSFLSHQVTSAEGMGVLCHLFEILTVQTSITGIRLSLHFLKLRYNPHAIKPLLLNTQFSNVSFIHKVSQLLPKWGTFVSTPRHPIYRCSCSMPGAKAATGLLSASVDLF